MDIIKIIDASYSYPYTDEKALQQINLTIKEGQFYSICGRNGQGKTTLGLLIRQFIPTIFHGEFSGKYLLYNKPIQAYNFNDLCTEFGYVSQNPFTQLSASRDTVFEEIAFGLENLGIPRDEIIKRVNDTIELLNIEHLKTSNPLELSGGQKQKVAIAAIVAMDAKILILDEPTSQLDPEATREIFEILKTLQNKGKTIILIEHKIELISKYATDIIVVDNHTITTQGEKLEVLQSDAFQQSKLELPKYLELCFKLKTHGFDIGADFYELDDTIIEINKILNKEVA